MTPVISLDQLTKALLLNKNEPQKYSIPFFTGFFGLGSAEETRELFDSFSYLRVKHQEEKDSPEKLEWELLKFREA